MDFNYLDYIDPALLVLIPFCWCVGYALKKTEKIDSKYIPLCLGGFSIVMASLWVMATSDMSTLQHSLLAVFTAIVQGVLCAGASVLAHQVKKQMGGGKNASRN